MRAPRIGLWDQYGGSMESGWTRWILEQFEFPFERVFAPELDAGNLNAKYDVLIFVERRASRGAGGGRGGRGGGRGGAGPSRQDVPAEYRAQLGRVTAETDAPAAPRVRRGRRHGRSRSATPPRTSPRISKLPIENHLVENGAAAAAREVLRARLGARRRASTRRHPLAAGMSERTDFFFDNSPVFKLGPGAAAAGVRAIAQVRHAPRRCAAAGRGASSTSRTASIAVEAPLGKGRVLLFGPEILQRAQPHGTFKLLFNGIFASVAR